MLTHVSSSTACVPPTEGDLHQGINARLNELLPLGATARGVDLSHAMRYAVLGSGKRLRPMLAMQIGHEWGAPTAAMLDAACVIEIVHGASLVLDDLPAMDNATLRRGKAATHVVHGIDVAMLTAIALLARSFSVLSGLPQVAADQRAALVAVLADAIGDAGLAGSQLQDLQAQAHDRKPDTLAQTRALKTAALFKAAVMMAATLSSVDDARLQRLLVFASHFGQAFQIADDLIDAVEDSHGQPTCVSVLGTVATQLLLQAHVESALSHLSSRQSPCALWTQGMFKSLYATAVPSSQL